MASIENIEHVSIDGLIPYEHNSKKHSEKQLRLIEKSIQEFGFITPILIDEHNRIIAGHGRTQAAKMLGMSTVPAVRVEGLTDEQRRAYIIADNRLTELGGWDKDIIAEELSTLDIDGFDVDITGFCIDDISQLQLAIDKPYGAERQRTIDTYNLGLQDNVESTEDFWQMPVIENNGYIPESLIGFNYAKTSKNNQAGIHFYLDDYQFERVWNSPEKYIEILKNFSCILSPDFSLYTDMPMPMKIWNTYRSRQIGAFYQSCGIKVIPTISWCEPETYQFCFEGIPQGSIVSVSTIGVKREDSAFETWKNGMDAMIQKIKPSAILVYGGILDYDYGDINVVYYDNQVLKEWKKT